VGFSQSDDVKAEDGTIDLDFLESTRVKGFRSLKFPPILEKVFLEDYFQHSLRTLRIGIIVGVAFWFLFVFDDLSMPHPNWIYAVIIRFAVVTPIVIAFLLFSYSRHFKKVYQPLMAMVAFIVGIGMLGIIHQHDEAIIFHHHPSLLLLIIVAYTLFRLRFYYATASMLLLSLVDIVVAVIFTKVSPDLVAVEILRILAINGIGMTANYILEFYTRNEFLKSSLLDRRRAQAEDATAMKDKFVSLVSHDLKAPLSTSIGLLRLLKKAGSGQFTEKQADIIDRVIAGSEKMVETIDALLNISRLQTGKLIVRRNWVNIYVLINDMIGKIGYSATQKGISLVNEMPLQRHMFIDKDLIQEVFLNLMTNSIKFCRAGDTVSITVPHRRSFSIVVKDSGIGVAPKILPDLFKHEIKTSGIGTGGERGTGLGLPFCMDILRAHGGNISVESREGEGSEFKLEFPDTGLNILLVYYDLVNRDMTRNYLQETGANLTEARIYADALQWVELGSFNVIIADCALGMEDLAKFVQNIREKRLEKGILFMAAGMAGAETKKDMTKLGITAFLENPVSAKELSARIARVA